MLSVFYRLYDYELFAPLIIRITLAAVLLFWAYTAFKHTASNNEKIIRSIEGIAGIFILVGAWTQIAAAVIVIDMLIRIFGRMRNKALLTDGVNYYVLLLVLAFCLLVLPAGFWAFDLPL